MSKLKMLTAKELAKLLQISPRKLWEMTNAGEIPHVRIGRLVRYPEDLVVEQWFKNKKRGGDAQ